MEFCHNEVWGTVCDDGWEDVDAQVVCNQLHLGTTGVNTVQGIDLKLIIISGMFACTYVKFSLGLFRVYNLMSIIDMGTCRCVCVCVCAAHAL